MNRATKSSSAASSACITFSATRRPSRVSVALYTVAIPPRASSASIRYRPSRRRPTGASETEMSTVGVYGSRRRLPATDAGGAGHAAGRAAPRRRQGVGDGCQEARRIVVDGWAPTRSRGESCGGSWRRGLVSPHVTSVPRPIPSAPFGDDDGSADPRVRAALEEFDRAEGGPANVLAALATSRLLIPIVAVPGDDGPNDDVPGADGSGGRADHSHADM